MENLGLPGGRRTDIYHEVQTRNRRFQIIVVVFFKLKHFKNDKMPSLKVHRDMNVGDITQKKNMDQRVLLFSLASIATLYFHYYRMSPCVHFR